MVAVQRESRKQRKLGAYAVISVALLVLLFVILFSKGETKTFIKRVKPKEVFFNVSHEEHKVDAPTCPYQSFNDLTSEELFPTKGNRHIVNPPKGGQLTLVCCETTRGFWSMVVRETWAPKGAARFLEMVTSRYLNSDIPLFRCIPNFLCQFGLSSDASLSKLFRESIPDDKNWLPEGPEHREKNGVKRFAKGYVAYAGGGKNSRNKQLIVSLTNVGTLAGGSPWEGMFFAQVFAF